MLRVRASGSAPAEAQRPSDAITAAEARRSADADVLTIGFARRFATYKRATLVMQDLRWLEQLVRIEGRPVLFLFAGKAHPTTSPRSG